MRRPALSFSLDDALGTGVPADPPDPVQDPLDREVLAAHFVGYDLEPVLSVALSPVTLADAGVSGNRGAPGNRGGVAR